MTYIITMRHGESFKNIKKIDGGKGEFLTPLGIEQVKASALKVKSIVEALNVKKVRLFKSCSRVQVSETADILSSVLGARVEMDPKYVPIRLGVFNGMSREKQLQLYPTSVKEMDEWSAGKRDIMDVHVDGMQDTAEYVDTIIDFLKKFGNNELVILIGTRSDLSAVKNIVKGSHPKIKNTYWFCPTDFAEIKLAKMEKIANELFFDEINVNTENKTLSINKEI